MDDKMMNVYFIHDSVEGGDTYLVWSKDHAEKLKEQLDSERNAEGVPHYFRVSDPVGRPADLAGMRVLVSEWFENASLKEGGGWGEWAIGRLGIEGYEVGNKKKKIVPGKVVMTMLVIWPWLPVSCFK